MVERVAERVVPRLLGAVREEDMRPVVVHGDFEEVGFCCWFDLRVCKVGAGGGGGAFGGGGEAGSAVGFDVCVFWVEV